MNTVWIRTTTLSGPCVRSLEGKPQFMALLPAWLPGAHVAFLLVLAAGVAPARTITTVSQ